MAAPPAGGTDASPVSWSEQISKHIIVLIK